MLTNLTMSKRQLEIRAIAPLTLQGLVLKPRTTLAASAEDRWRNYSPRLVATGKPTDLPRNRVRYGQLVLLRGVRVVFEWQRDGGTIGVTIGLRFKERARGAFDRRLNVRHRHGSRHLSDGRVV